MGKRAPVVITEDDLRGAVEAARQYILTAPDSAAQHLSADDFYDRVLEFARVALAKARGAA